MLLVSPAVSRLSPGVEMVSSALPSHVLERTRRPRVSALLGLVWNDRFGGSNPMENVVCSFVQAAGRVNTGVKVLV